MGGVNMYVKSSQAQDLTVQKLKLAIIVDMKNQSVQKQDDK